MKDLKLDSTGDLEINRETGAFKMVNKRKQIAQKVSNALNINSNELSWNANIGISQMDLIFNSKNVKNLNSIITEYLKKLFGNEFVHAEISDENFNHKTRTLHFIVHVTLNINGDLLKVSPSLNIGDESNG